MKFRLATFQERSNSSENVEQFVDRATHGGVFEGGAYFAKKTLGWGLHKGGTYLGTFGKVKPYAVACN